jgi:hypothetical protein
MCRRPTHLQGQAAYEAIYVHLPRCKGVHPSVRFATCAFFRIHKVFAETSEDSLSSTSGYLSRMNQRLHNFQPFVQMSTTLFPIYVL